jgi:hypothetical protein
MMDTFREQSRFRKFALCSCFLLGWTLGFSFSAGSHSLRNQGHTTCLMLPFKHRPVKQRSAVMSLMISYGCFPPFHIPDLTRPLRETQRAVSHIRDGSSLVRRCSIDGKFYTKIQRKICDGLSVILVPIIHQKLLSGRPPKAARLLAGRAFTRSFLTATSIIFFKHYAVVQATAKRYQRSNAVASVPSSPNTRKIYHHPVSGP